MKAVHGGRVGKHKPNITLTEIRGILQPILRAVVKDVIVQRRSVKHLCPRGGLCLGFVRAEGGDARRELRVVRGEGLGFGGDGPFALIDDQGGAVDGGDVDEEEVAGAGGVELCVCVSYEYGDWGEWEVLGGGGNGEGGRGTLLISPK